MLEFTQVHTGQCNSSRSLAYFLVNVSNYTWTPIEANWLHFICKRRQGVAQNHASPLYIKWFSNVRGHLKWSAQNHTAILRILVGTLWDGHFGWGKGLPEMLVQKNAKPDLAPVTASDCETFNSRGLSVGMSAWWETCVTFLLLQTTYRVCDKAVPQGNWRDPPNAWTPHILLGLSLLCFYCCFYGWSQSKAVNHCCHCPSWHLPSVTTT